jgi:anhydro-N-acetylmuramic acid kinase
LSDFPENALFSAIQKSMNSNLIKLDRIARKKHRRIIGLMSGTSMDGLDIALCRVDNSGLKTRLTLEKFETVPYTSKIRERIGEVFAKQRVDFQRLATLHPWLGVLHGKMILKSLKKWKIKPESIDLIASHGQTVMHAPAFLHPDDPVNATLQIGDGDHLAITTGIITLSDFRQKHIAAGGEGAPLAVYGDYLLLSDKKENRILLNIGGIANFTFLPAGRKADKVFVTDTGPGNTLIDQTVVSIFPGEYFDKDANHAKKGKVHADLLRALKTDPFFSRALPKTIGPELFNLDFVRKARLSSKSESVSAEDLLATLTRFSAETVAEAILGVTGKKDFKIYLSGGGAHNPLMTQWLKELLKTNHLASTGDLGIPGDAKEAILFALLANESVAGKPIYFGNRSKVPSVSMGKISFPK